MTRQPPPSSNPEAEDPSSSPRPWSLSRYFAAAFSLLMALAVLSPVVQNWRDDPDDGFPLSYYPMFTKVRGETTRITFGEIVSSSGDVSPVRYSHMGRGGLNQVRRQIKRLVRRGQADELCGVIASRLSQRDRYSDAVTFRLVTGEFHIHDYMKGSTDPVSREIRASCSLEGRS